MRSKITLLLAFIIIIACSSFSKKKNKISDCYLSFTMATNLTATDAKRLTDTAIKPTKVKTEKGEMTVSKTDGYIILYKNNKNAPFVNLKVELSDPKSYDADQKALTDHLEYLNKKSVDMETKELIEFESNGYKVKGISRAKILGGKLLGLFLIFPGDGVTIYIYFDNLKAKYRDFENIDDYKKERDRFINEYTKHLSTCRK